jgi:hypothetical protein
MVGVLDEYLYHAPVVSNIRHPWFLLSQDADFAR